MLAGASSTTRRVFFGSAAVAWLSLIVRLSMRRPAAAGLSEVDGAFRKLFRRMSGEILVHARPDIVCGHLDVCVQRRDHIGHGLRTDRYIVIVIGLPNCIAGLAVLKFNVHGK